MAIMTAPAVQAPVARPVALSLRHLVGPFHHVPSHDGPRLSGEFTIHLAGETSTSESDKQLHHAGQR